MSTPKAVRPQGKLFRTPFERQGQGAGFQVPETPAEPEQQPPSVAVNSTPKSMWAAFAVILMTCFVAVSSDQAGLILFAAAAAMCAAGSASMARVPNVSWATRSVMLASLLAAVITAWEVSGAMAL